MADSALTTRLQYTHQKYKKRKVWQDGILVYNTQAQKVVLYAADESGKLKRPALDSKFLPGSDGQLAGTELELDGYVYLKLVGALPQFVQSPRGSRKPALCWCTIGISKCAASESAGIRAAGLSTSKASAEAKATRQIWFQCPSYYS